MSMTRFVPCSVQLAERGPLLPNHEVANQRAVVLPSGSGETQEHALMPDRSDQSIGSDWIIAEEQHAGSGPPRRKYSER